MTQCTAAQDGGDLPRQDEPHHDRRLPEHQEPDDHVHHRPAQGEWICLDARTRFGSPGIGAAESELWDEDGRIGRSVQSLLVEVPA